jgi:glutaminyl-tRNA synthetase
VRLKDAYIIKCEQVVKDEQTGEIIELHCTYDPDTKSGSGTANRKVKGVLHWVSAAQAVKAEVRLYDYLLTDEQDEDGSEEKTTKDFVDTLNPNSLEVLTNCLIEPSIKTAKVGDRFQFMRNAYFSLDRESTEQRPVFNRIVSLKDSWAKIGKK